MAVPELEHHCGSWVVTRKSDDAVIGEFFHRSTVECVNQARYRVETALQYLARLNESLMNSQ